MLKKKILKSVAPLIIAALILPLVVDNYCYGFAPVPGDRDPGTRDRMLQRYRQQDPTGTGLNIPGIGPITDPGITAIPEFRVPGQGMVRVGENGVTALATNKGGEYVYITRGPHTEVMLTSKTGAPMPRFDLPQTRLRGPIKGVMLDLDGTCIKSEPLWIEVIRRVTNELREEKGLPAIAEFTHEDEPNVAGRTVPEHMAYVVDKYVMREKPDLDRSGLERAARVKYDRITKSDAEMEDIGRALKQRGIDPYVAAPGLKRLLLTLKEKGVKIAMVTSGLFYKAYPELVDGFRQIGISVTDENSIPFLDALVSAGTAPGTRNTDRTIQPGHMGDAIAKPWPDIYFAAAKALGWTPETADQFVVVGDSGSDIGSGRTMGCTSIGVEGGNIRAGGVAQMCRVMAPDLNALFEYLEPYLPGSQVEDVGNAQYLAQMAHAQLQSGRVYEVKYDAARLQPSQVEVVKAYINFLRSQSANPDNIKDMPFSSEMGSTESLIAVYCREGTNVVGEGHFNVTLNEGEDLKDYVLRVTGMLNIAFASANIPSDLEEEDIVDYINLITFIKTQYRAVMGKEMEIDLETPAQDILNAVRTITLHLPPTEKADVNRRMEHDRLSKEALIRA